MQTTSTEFRTRAAAAAAATLLALLVAPAVSHAGELTFDLHSGGQHSYDPSFDAFGRGGTPNVYGSTTVGVGWDVSSFIGLEGLSIYGEFGSEGAGGPRFDGDFDFQWNRQLYLVGAEWAYPVTPGIHPFARVLVGVGRQNVRVTPDDGPTFSQARHHFATRNSIGVEFRTPYASGDDSESSKPLSLSESFSLGATAQAGYLWQPSLQFGALTSGAGDEWSRTGIGLGRLRTSGWFWAFGLTVRIRP